MSDRSEHDFVRDILEAIRRVGDYTAGISYEAFLLDTKTQDAVVRNLEIIGEAVKNLSEELRAAHPAIAWKGMAAIRDKLIHHYFGVNLDVVWQVVTVELPPMIGALSNILDGATPSEATPKR
ncbi:MAG: DUF86 domain-containing protein [Blastocatellia bacterium]|nr:DUF86 domain-containing protein [Blastocatellia bacterium]